MTGTAPAAHITAVREVLASIVDPCSIATGVPISLIDMGIVKDVRAAGAGVEVEFQLTSPVCMQVNLIVESLKGKCRELGIEVEARLDPDSQWMPDMMASDARRRLRALRPLEESPAP